MNIEFLATVAVIAPDPTISRNLYVEALGLPLQGDGDGYYHSEHIAGCKSFGMAPIPGRAHMLRNPTSGPQSGRCPRSASSSMWPPPPRSLRPHGSSSRPAMSCCTELARSHGARRSLGCSPWRARSSASPTHPCCTTDSSARIPQSLFPAVINAGAARDLPSRLPSRRCPQGIGWKGRTRRDPRVLVARSTRGLVDSCLVDSWGEGSVPVIVGSSRPSPLDRAGGSGPGVGATRRPWGQLASRRWTVKGIWAGCCS